MVEETESVSHLTLGHSLLATDLDIEPRSPCQWPSVDCTTVGLKRQHPSESLQGWGGAQESASLTSAQVMLMLVQGRHLRTTVLNAKSKIYYWKPMMYSYSWPKWVSIATGKSRRGTRCGWWPYCSAVSSSQLAFLRSFSRVLFSIHSTGLCHVCSARISALHLIFSLTGGASPLCWISYTFISADARAPPPFSLVYLVVFKTHWQLPKAASRTPHVLRGGGGACGERGAFRGTHYIIFSFNSYALI